MSIKNDSSASSTAFARRNLINLVQDIAQEQLKQKGIAVVAVQAPNVDETALDQWVKKNNIPFPVGMAQGDEQDICSAGGVKSLSWLILSDRSQIVGDEGFALTELDAKIGEIGYAER